MATQVHTKNTITRVKRLIDGDNAPVNVSPNAPNYTDTRCGHCGADENCYPIVDTFDGIDHLRFLCERCDNAEQQALDEE